MTHAFVTTEIRPAQPHVHRAWIVPLTVLTLLLAVMPSGAAADTQYCRLSTDRITVVANGGAKRCARLAGQVFAFEHLLRGLADLDEESPLPPLTVYSLADKDAEQVLLTEADKRKESATRVRIFSKYLPGRDMNVAAIVNDGSDEPLQSVLLLYGRGILASGPIRGFPPWYVIGVSEVTNGLLIREDGSVLLSREGQFAPDVDKSARVKYDLATLLATSASEVSNQGDWKAFSRHSREWALYGLLTTAERRTQYRELATLMRQGTPADEAVSQAFGTPLTELSKEFDSGRWKREAQFKIPAPTSIPALPPAETLGAAQARALLQLVADRVTQRPLHP